MRILKLSRWVAVLTLAILLARTPATAQETDTLSISGTFSMDAGGGDPLAYDLTQVFLRDNDHWWLLTLHGATYSHAGAADGSTTYVHATSFDFEFFGPDADLLNGAVSDWLARGDLSGDGAADAFVRLGSDGVWIISLAPLDPLNGSYFQSWGYADAGFGMDEDGYPLVEPQRLVPTITEIEDMRDGNWGELISYGGFVDIGSSGPPVPLDPPRTVSIADGSVREGHKGTTRLNLIVTLSRSSSDTITVEYSTVAGTALAYKDYWPVISGIVSFPPGQTSATLPLSIITDRKREPNETFTVQLFDASGATIEDGVATATILNDD